MQVTNGEIFNARESLQQLLDMDELPVAVSYQLAKLGSKFSERLVPLEQVRMGLLRKHGEEKDGQIRVEVGSPNYDKFMEELAELFSKEEEMDFDVVKFPKEVDGTPLKVKGAILMALTKFVEVD